MAGEPYQTLPPLAFDQYETLKADIAKNGVLVAVIVDEFGAIIDGHHRARACRELGINDYPTEVRAGLSEDEKRSLSRRLNILRRQLPREAVRELIREQLKEKPEWSDGRTAAAIGVDHKTVGAERARLIATREIPELEKTLGEDGKWRKHKAPRPKRRSTEDWSALGGGLAEATGGELGALEDLSAEAQAELFRAGVAADSVAVIKTRARAIDEAAERPWAIYALWTLTTYGWSTEATLHHKDWVQRSSWKHPNEWFGPEGDRYRRLWWEKPMPDADKASWASFYAERAERPFAEILEEFEAAHLARQQA